MSKALPMLPAPSASAIRRAAVPQSTAAVPVASSATHPAFRILELHRNTLAIWQALDSGTTPPETQALVSAAMLLVWRRQTQPHFRTLEAEEDRALQALHEGESFAAVCSRLTENRSPGEAAALAGRWLRRWIEEELLVARDG